MLKGPVGVYMLSVCVCKSTLQLALVSIAHYAVRCKPNREVDRIMMKPTLRLDIKEPAMEPQMSG